VELTAFLHWGLDTWDGEEQGNPSDLPSVFAPPSTFNQDVANGWGTTLKGVGFGQAMLVAKHSTGYCLWPSKTTTYSVAGSPWMNGKGDVVQLFVNAMKAADMRPAFYVAPWDQHAPSSANGYQTVIETQIKELLTNYNSGVYELWFDGYNAPIAPIVHWGNVFPTAKMEQPFIDIWAGPQVAQASVADSPPAFPDLQWIGDENGIASRSTSSLDLSDCGGGTNRWCAWEATTTDSSNGDWFWHPGHQPKSLAQLQQIYFNTVGMNTTLIYNVPPDQTGAFDSQDVAVLQQFGTWYKSTFKTDLLEGAPVTADSTWATAGFDGSKAVDNQLCTYWAAASGMMTGTLTVTPSSPITFQVISVREPIELGERVTKYHVEILQNGSWTTPQDQSGNMVAGTVIGNRQLWQMKMTSASGVRLVIESAREVPAISEFAVY
jgi:alpha-L-fucosidase